MYSCGMMEQRPNVSEAPHITQTLLAYAIDKAEAAATLIANVVMRRTDTISAIGTMNSSHNA